MFTKNLHEIFFEENFDAENRASKLKFGILKTKHPTGLNIRLIKYFMYLILLTRMKNILFNRGFVSQKMPQCMEYELISRRRLNITNMSLIKLSTIFLNQVVRLVRIPS